MALLEQIQFRKLILAAVIGILSGGLSGLAYFRATSEHEPPQTYATLADFIKANPLQGRCTTGKNPEVILYWSLPDTVKTNRLFRSEASLPAREIFNADKTDPEFVSYTDKNIEPGIVYKYFFETDDKNVSDPVYISVFDGSCSIK